MKIIYPRENRAQEDDFNEAKDVEVKGLKKKNIWRKVSEKDVPVGANVLGGRFLLTLINHKTPDEKAQVRYFSQIFRDRGDSHMVNDVSTIRVS